jgi:hypothetical protein
VLLLAQRPGRPWVLVFAGGVLAWSLLLFPASNAYGLITRGWALLVGGLFVAAAVLWPRWSFLHRGLAALAAAVAVVGAGLALSGSWSAVDSLVGDFFRSSVLLAADRMAELRPTSALATDMRGSMERVIELRAALFPALLGLQSLAALGLAWWAFVRMGGAAADAAVQPLRPLREFRFHDQLIWVVIAGLLLVLLPLGSEAARAAQNVLVFMGALYALRGVAVFVFLAGRTPSILPVILGALAAVFLYPLVVTAAVLVGLGDTWLDVRGRAVAAAGA